MTPAQIDWDGLKAFANIAGDFDWKALMQPKIAAIIAAHERSERVIEAADHCAEFIRAWQRIEIDPQDEGYDEIMENMALAAQNALAEFDKAKQP